jgi:hypothetical protein
VRLTAQLRYAADTATVFAMLTDPAFQERKLSATGALEHDVTVEARADGGAQIRSTLTVVQVESWGPAGADGGRDGTVTVEVSGAPVRLTGSLRLRPDGGGTLESVDGDLKAKVPLVGGRIERAAEPAITTAIEVEEREGRAWLAG